MNNKNLAHLPIILITGLELEYLSSEDLQSAIHVYSKDIGFEGIISKIVGFYRKLICDRLLVTKSL